MPARVHSGDDGRPTGADAPGDTSEVPSPPPRRESEFRLAPHAVRLVAFASDVLLFAVLLAPAFALDTFTTVPGWVLYAAIAVAFVYYMGATAWLMDGQTAGKAVCGLRERRAVEAPGHQSLAGLARSVGRHSLGYLVADVLLLGCVTALFTAQRRCPHDYAFGTTVVLVDPGRRQASSRTRYREFWQSCAARHERMKSRYRWIFWPWKWLTGVVCAVAGWVMFFTDAVASAAAPSPAASSAVAKPLTLKGAAALWTASTVATGAALGGIALAVPSPSTIQNIDVVFERQIVNDDSTAEIYIMKADGAGIRQLTRNDSADLDPALFADSRIVFTTDRDGNEDIYAMNADGTAQSALTDHPESDWCADWSPDGVRVAFTSNRDGNSEIYVMNADGSEENRLTENPAADWCPDWSSDGARIAFVSDRDGAANVHVMNAEGSRVVQVTVEGGDSPEWSPDMTLIAFQSDRDGNLNVYVIGPDGRGERRLTDHLAADSEPFWAPDGSAILFDSERALAGGASELYAMKPDGSDERRLTAFND